MNFEILISAVNADPKKLIEDMHVTSNAVLVNQCQTDSEEEISLENKNTVRVFNRNERGVGKSRNLALSNSRGDIILFGDDDIVYNDGYENTVLSEFSSHPEADMLLFNVKAMEGRETYHTDEFGKVSWYNSGRYPTYSFAVKRDLIVKNGIAFSMLFGGGAKYSNGEDSLFLKDCLKAGIKVFKTPVDIGYESDSESTWFHGYNEKFFRDRGVLYHYLYGKMAVPFSFRYLFKHKDILLDKFTFGKAFKLMLQGVKEGKDIQRKGIVQ